ncbi:hypothetical protein [Sphingomonas radiodurans]|uniref:hypothetical protein n=1 Tax=Sphingomonas radiodurans TaxID=2890321 RepID=UPI001E357AC2|nr:hypothetical protein [Sphingomonas radiodurans]WBH16767.1 hypothetical protein LLW23_01185 [Sphingomonas radiodurans]
MKDADNIIVVGAKPKERRERAVAFVRASGIARGQQPAARWVVPVCPKVSGVAPETAAIVVDRIRALAAEVGAPLAPAGCKANAIVTFTDDSQGVVTRVHARSPHQFKDVPRDWRAGLLHGDAPIRWWHIIKMGDADGVPPVPMQPSFVQIEGGVGGYGLPMGEGGVQQRYKEGAISTQSTRAITGASVVIDVKRVGARDLRALGDYAAIVALAEFRPSTPPPPDSILGMFADNNPPGLATASDVALLKELYAFRLDREAKAHRRMLAKALVDAPLGRQR